MSSERFSPAALASASASASTFASTVTEIFSFAIHLSYRWSYDLTSPVLRWTDNRRPNVAPPLAPTAKRPCRVRAEVRAVSPRLPHQSQCPAAALEAVGDPIADI